MAGSIIERIKLVLPRELCVLIYSFTFFVDFGPIEKLQKERDSVRNHTLPPRAACLRVQEYLQYRQRPEHHRSDAPWPEHVEEAFFKAFEATKDHGGRADPSTPCSILVGGEQSAWAPTLQSRGISLTEPRSSIRIVSDIILAITGIYRTQQQIGSHLQTLKACYLSRLVKAPWISSDIICRIMTLSTFKPFAMHDAVYRLLQDEIRLMENDPQALEVVINCTAPTLRQAITCMRLHYSRESRSWILRLIR